VSPISVSGIDIALRFAVRAGDDTDRQLRVWQRREFLHHCVAPEPCEFDVLGAERPPDALLAMTLVEHCERDPPGPAVSPQVMIQGLHLLPFRAKKNPPAVLASGLS